MKKILPVLFLMLLLFNSCKKKCDSCGENQVCNNGVCQCAEWYEGSNCQTAMNLKFGGTFSTSTFVNGVFEKNDTLVLSPDPNYANQVTLNNFRIKNYIYNRNVLLLLTSSTDAIYESTYDSPYNQFLDNLNPCGTAKVTEDGKNLTISFSPMFPSGIVNTDTVYTVIGNKQ